MPILIRLSLYFTVSNFEIIIIIFIVFVFSFPWITEIKNETGAVASSESLPLDYKLHLLTQKRKTLVTIKLT